MPLGESKTLFGPGLGGPCEYYRIPSIVTTKNGVVVACADARYCSGSDNPNRIDKVVRRSLDSGETWSDFILAVKEEGTTQKGSSAAIDPVMVYVEEINRIYMLYCHTPAGVGILNCRVGTGETKAGEKIISKGLKKYILKNGKLILKSGKKSAFRVRKNGDVYKGSTLSGNIYKRERFKEFASSFLMICHSDDDGLTWSKPKSLNSQVKTDYMSFIGPGPGCGIVLKHGEHKGRIAVPIYYGTRKTPLRLSCCVIYSDDLGKTWKLGETPNNTRTIGSKKADSKRITQSQMLTESQLIEQEDGTLKYFMRNHDKRKSVATAYSKNGGESWEDFSWNDDLPQCICQMSVIKLEGTKKASVLFLNPASREKRENGVLRLSEDDGETFTSSITLKKGPFVYSAMTQMPNGKIGILYEPDLECREIDFVSIDLNEIKKGE